MAPRIKELKRRLDELSKTKLMVEADLAVQGIQHVDRDIVVAYASDLRSLLCEGTIAESKSFLRTFIKRIIVEKEQVTISHNLPVPTSHDKMKTAEVLPIVTSGGAGVTIGRTFIFSFPLVI